MYASELRTYALGSIVCVLLGGASGFGWHHFVDTTGARVVGSAATPSVRQDASNSPAPNPPAPRPDPAFNVSQSPDLSRRGPPARHDPRKMCTKGHACQKYQARR